MGKLHNLLAISESSLKMSNNFSQLLLLLCAISLALLGSILVIALRQAKQHRDMAAGIRNISPLSPTTEIPSFRKALPLIAKELARVRRYQRTLAIIAIQLENSHYVFSANSAKEAVNGNASHQSKKNPIRNAQFGFFFMGAILQDSLRESDILTFDAANNQFVILLPESDKTEALHTAERLNKQFFQRTLTELRVGVAEFPTDGWVIEDLVNNAMSAKSASLDSKAAQKVAQEKEYVAK